MQVLGAPVARREPFSFPFGVIPIRILLLIALLAVPIGGWADQGSTDYRDELIEQAERARLAAAREWHLLLHYQANLFGGVTSEEDDEGFFLSPQGKYNPQAELAATIESFLSPALVGRSKQPAQCAFIARYHWLNERLRFDPARLVPITCDRFERWRVELNPQGISLIVY